MCVWVRGSAPPCGGAGTIRVGGPHVRVCACVLVGGPWPAVGLSTKTAVCVALRHSPCCRATRLLATADFCFRLSSIETFGEDFQGAVN